MRAQPACLGDPSKPLNLTRHSERLALVLNGNVNYGSTMSNTDSDMNMNAAKFTGTSPATPNTDFTLALPNGFGRVPITINAQDTTNGGLIYRSPVTPWTKTHVTFRCTTASAPYNIIVI
jgi:hypothetical protein